MTEHGGDSGNEVDRLLSRFEDAPSSWPVFLPHLAGSGSVLNDPESLGAFFGLRFETRQRDLVSAVLEGITFEQSLSLEALSAAIGPVAELRATGGGTRSARWLQMKADILDRPVTRVSVRDAPCIGAAILGRCAVEGMTIDQAVAEMVTTAETCRPRPDRAAFHRPRLAIYRDLYAALRPLAPRLHAIW